MAALVLAMAWGRAGWVPLYGLPDRYVALSVPGLCALYFAWLLYGRQTARNRVANAFAVAALVALPFNVQHGLAVRALYVADTQAFGHELAEGLSWQELADRHQELLFPFPGGRGMLIENWQEIVLVGILPFSHAGVGARCLKEPDFCGRARSANYEVHSTIINVFAAQQ